MPRSRPLLKSPSELRIHVPPDAATTAFVYSIGSDRAGATLMLAHGAGAGQHSAFITGFARAIAALGVDVVTFNFLYTEQRRRLPDRAPMLEACYAAAIDAVFGEVESARQSLFIGGKSMGGRIAPQVAVNKTAPPIAGIVLL